MDINTNTSAFAVMSQLVDELNKILLWDVVSKLDECEIVISKSGVKYYRNGYAQHLKDELSTSDLIQILRLKTESLLNTNAEFKSLLIDKQNKV